MVVLPVAAPEKPLEAVRPSVPQAAIEAPASLSALDEGHGSRPRAGARTVATKASLSTIPSVALAAYQRAEAVINDADPGCQMPWELVAAIGRVESDHGRFGGSELDSTGVATPGIFGIALDGTHGTRAIPDTDGGRYDADTIWDRAVGPMQFIPSTWSVVGVDGDNDGRRDPQDIDDAALGAAVYLCSGEDDLSTDAGRRSAVHRYNHSESYVDSVLAVMDAYLADDWSAAGGTVQAGAQVQDPTAPTLDPSGPKGTVNGPHSPQLVADAPRPVMPESTNPAPSRAPNPKPSSAPPASPPPPPKPQPGKQPSNNPKPSTDPKPRPKPTLPPNPLAPVTDPLAPVTDPILEPVLSITDALDLCGAEFGKIPDPLGLLNGAKRACADEVVGKPLSQATALIPNTLRGLLSWLGLVKP